MAAITFGLIGGLLCLGGMTSRFAGLAITTGNVKDVELATSSRLDYMFLSRIMRDVVAVDAVVIPIAATQLERLRSLEAKGTFPGSWLGIGRFDGRQWKLVLVVVP